MDKQITHLRNDGLLTRNSDFISLEGIVVMIHLRSDEFDVIVECRTKAEVKQDDKQTN